MDFSGLTLGQLSTLEGIAIHCEEEIGRETFLAIVEAREAAFWAAVKKQWRGVGRWEVYGSDWERAKLEMRDAAQTV